MPVERAYLFSQLRASQSAIRHRDCPHCRGNGDRQAVSGSVAGSTHLPGLLAGMTTHSTGMAHPRDHSHDDGVQPSGSVVESMASAMSLDFHSDKTHRVSGAKAGADVYLVGRGRGAVDSVASHSRRRCRTAENPPVKVRAAMTALWHPIWSVMVPNAGGRDAAWSVAASYESGNVQTGSA